MSKYNIPEHVYTHPNFDELCISYETEDFIQVANIYAYLSKQYKITKLSESQNHKCCYCGNIVTTKINKSNSRTIDHIIPKSKNGSNDIDNLVMSCLRCNNLRSNDDVEFFLEKLEKIPLNTIGYKQKFRNYKGNKK